jgi:hypothetical protein
MTSINLQFDKIIIGSDIRAILLSYISKTPVFLVNYKEAKVCDFYYTPFFIDKYGTEYEYSCLFDKEKKINSYEFKPIYPKNIVELDLSALLSLDGLIYPGYNSLKLLSDNEFMLFGKRAVTKLKFNQCIITDPSFHISFLETSLVKNPNKTYDIYDYYHFEKQGMVNTYKLFPGDLHIWVLSDNLSDLVRHERYNDDILVVARKTIPHSELGTYASSDEVKMQLKTVNNFKYRKLFPAHKSQAHEHYREVEDNERKVIYKNTDTITFFYKSDLDIINKFCHKISNNETDLQNSKKK